MKRRSILVIQHIDCEHPGILTKILSDAGVEVKILHPYRGDIVPADPAGYSGLLVMGGPMGVYDAERFPFLRQEMALMRLAHAADLPILGICLGSQLLAAALGSRVRKGAQKEIGWYPVRFSEAAKIDPLFARASDAVMFHWHGDVFDLPPGAVALASTEMTPVQAFRKGCAYGVLFHMEVTAEMIDEWLDRFRAELTQEKIERKDIQAEVSRRLSGLHRNAAVVFEAFVAQVVGRA